MSKLIQHKNQYSIEVKEKNKFRCAFSDLIYLVLYTFEDWKKRSNKKLIEYEDIDNFVKYFKEKNAKYYKVEEIQEKLN